MALWLFVIALGLGAATMTKADEVAPMALEDFADGDAAPWRFVSDQVMGGVSDGELQILEQDGARFGRLVGTVSTDNNGGFIQFRRELAAPLDRGSSGLSLRVRGNGERYYVHLRPREARRPWHYFAAGFDTDGQWQDIELPWSSFKPQGGLSLEFAAPDITSIGIVAYGADYNAQLDVDFIAVE